MSDKPIVHSPSNFIPVFALPIPVPLHYIGFWQTVLTLHYNTNLCWENRQWDCSRLQQLNKGKPNQHTYFYRKGLFNVIKNFPPFSLLFLPLTIKITKKLRNAIVIVAYMSPFLGTLGVYRKWKVVFYLERLKWKNLLFLESLWNVVICVIAITEPAKIAYEFSNVFLLSKGTFPLNYLYSLELLSAFQKEL